MRLDNIIGNQIMTPLIQEIGGLVGLGSRASLVEIVVGMGGITAAVFVIVQSMKYRNTQAVKSQTG
jgi:hypothetical protein